MPAIRSLFTEYLSTAARWSFSPSDVLVDVGVKSTVLMLLAMTTVFVLRRASAAMRHRVWGLMFGGLLLLPVLSCALPAWRLPILPPPTKVATADLPAQAAAERAGTPAVEHAVSKAAPEVSVRSDELLIENGEAAAKPSFPMVAANGRSRTAPLSEALPANPPAPVAPSPVSWTGAVFLVWLVGATIVLLPLALSIARNTLLRIRSAPVDDEGWHAQLEELRSRLRVRRRVDLLVSHRPLVPMTWGLVRPVILLPDQARQWTGKLRHFVLLHELSHVKRWDVGFQILARVTCALYWFHPLAWYAIRRLRIERELACDDCVLSAGERPADYAGQLLEIARTYRPPRLVAAVAMAQENTLEHRVRALLDRARSHLPLSHRVAMTLLVASLAIVTAVAVARPAAREAGAETGASGAGDTSTVTSAGPDRGEADSNDEPRTVTIRGRVLLPDGSPAEGATVRSAAPLTAMLESIVGEDFEPPVEQVKTDERGRFEVSFSTQPYGDLSRFDKRWQEQWKRTEIGVRLPGYGAQWVRYDEIEDATEPITLQLVEDMPIRGRVADLEGTAVSGVSVQIREIRASEDEDLSAWIEGAGNGELPWTLVHRAPRRVEPSLIGVPKTVTTDNDGRFTIGGVGKERLVSLVFESDSVVHQQASVVTRQMQPIQRLISSPPFEGHERVFGANFTFTAAPSRPIVGTVRDAETGKPMPGVAVESYKFADYPYSNHRVRKTVTDENGRYRLTGMPKGEGNRLSVLPNDDQPYFMRVVDVPNAAGLGSVNMDIDIHRGIWIKGRVTDKVTDQPVAGARLYYLPLRSNEFAQALPEFRDNGYVDGDQTRYETEADGRYRLVGLPGPAVVGAESIYKEYRPGAGYDALDGPWSRDTDHLDTYRNPLSPSPKWPDVMTEIDPSADVDSVTVDLQMDPGLSVAVRVVGPDARPLTGTRVTGLTSSNVSEKLDDDQFPVTRLAPQETRTLLLYHEEKRLGRVTRISPEDAANAPVTVELQPLATVTGRLLHEDGSAMGGVEVEASPLPGGDFHKRLPSVTTDAEGRFHYELLPGVDYLLQAEGADIEFVASIARELSIQPGQETHLGDFRLQANEFVQVIKDDVPSQPETTLNLRGRVLGPEGQPQRDATIWIREPFAESWTPLTGTDNDGKFNKAVDRRSLAAAFEKNASVKIRLAATAEGFGLAWNSFAPSVLDEGVTLNLVEDMPIEGRIVTPEGEPVSGVRIRVNSIPIKDTSRVDGFIESAPRSSGVYMNVLPWELAPGKLGIASVVTDADGRFRLEGLGAQRVVRLEATGAGIGDTRLAIATRPPPAVQSPDASLGESNAIAVKEGRGESVYYARFTHVATLGRTLKGVVTDAKTGAGIGGVRVKTFASWHSLDHPVATDANGHYEITGVPKQDKYRVFFAAEDSIHLNKEVRIIDPGGLEPITVDVTLARGLVVRGHVTDAATGDTLTGTVIYNPLFPNENWTTIGSDSGIVANPAATSVIEEDGSYQIPVLPGPGAIAAKVSSNGSDGDYVAATVAPESLRELVGGEDVTTNEHGLVGVLFTAAGDQTRGLMNLSRRQASALIKPAQDSAPLTVDLTATPGVIRTGMIVDNNGKPLTGVKVIGLGPYGLTATEPLESAEFTVRGLVPGRKRTLLFLHPEHHLGAQRVVTGNKTAPLEVQLSPTGTLTGHFVDELGAPLIDVVVELSPEEPGLSTNYWWGKSDKQGRFAVNNVIPSVEYRVQAKPMDMRGPSLTLIASPKVAPGQILDLGTFTQKNEYQYGRVEEEPRSQKAGDAP